jgi:hypothetical protein
MSAIIHLLSIYGGIENFGRFKSFAVTPKIAQVNAAAKARRLTARPRLHREIISWHTNRVRSVAHVRTARRMSVTP